MPTMLSKVFTSWKEFVDMDDPPDAGHLELRDGKVGHLTTEYMWHVLMRGTIRSLIGPLAEEHGMIAFDWLNYRPAPDLQGWYATACGVMEKDRWRSLMDSDEDYPIFAPTMIVEVESDWNSEERIVQQRRVAISAGTKEFWSIKPKKKCVSVTREYAETTYFMGDSIPTGLFPNHYLYVAALVRVDEHEV